MSAPDTSPPGSRAGQAAVGAGVLSEIHNMARRNFFFAASSTGVVWCESRGARDNDPSDKNSKELPGLIDVKFSSVRQMPYVT